MQVWAILRRVGSLRVVSALRVSFFFFFLISPLHLYLEVFGGFRSSIVAPPIISAQQKKRAIRAIIVAAARFLAVQRQLRLLRGSAVRGSERGEEQGLPRWGENAGTVTVASSVWRKERKI